MTAPTRWWWVRHAPVPGIGSRLVGQMDLGCDTGDSASFQALAAILPCDPVWIVSPLRRTRETLAAILARRGRSPAGREDGREGGRVEPIVEPDFAEQHFGRWQGLTWSEMEAREPETYAAFWRDPTGNAPPGGESYVQLIDRTRAGIGRLTDRWPGRDIVAVSHGGTIRAAVAVALGLSPETAMAIVIDNLSITRLVFVEDGLLHGRAGVWRVEGINVPCRWIPQAGVC